jgi:hypothetical protein
MGAFLGISLWVALATVVPGLVTIAVVFCAIVIANPTIICSGNNIFTIPSDWVIAGIAITIMVLTQALGILLEELLVKLHLFPGCTQLTVPSEFCSKGEKDIDAYKQYDKLYILLAQLTEHEDSQGHLKRAAAQFFLTNNTLVSFFAGIIVSLVLAIVNNARGEYLFFYTLSMFFCLIISYWVAVIRFRVMAKCIWITDAVREKKRLKNSNG